MAGSSVPRRRSETEYSGWETAHLILGGHADFAAGEELTEEEWEQIRKERREAIARKRPPGFAPWPDEKNA